MEGVKVSEWVSNNERTPSSCSNSGSGSGSVSGGGSSSGSGSGSGSGDGDGAGYGYGIGDGYGSGYGSGFGIGGGYGYRFGDGSGTCDGNGYGYNVAGAGDDYFGKLLRNIKSFCGHTVHDIDGIPTIITIVSGNVAKGKILRDDLTLHDCYIVKQDGLFAHGETLHKAMKALRDKLFNKMSEDERIDAFLGEHTPGQYYPAKDLYEWHHKLTGSCEMGRKAFAENHGIDMDTAEFTPEEFCALTRDDYGGDVIRKLEATINGVEEKND